MELFKRLKEVLIGSSDIHVDKIAENNYYITALITDIETLVSPFQFLLSSALNNRKIEKKKLNKSLNQLNNFGAMLTKASATLKNAHDIYESTSKNKHMLDEDIERDKNLTIISDLQNNIIFLLHKIYDYLNSKKEIIQVDNMDKIDWIEMSKIISTITVELMKFSDENRKYIQLSEELLTKTVFLIDDITKNYKEIEVMKPNENKPSLFHYYTGKSKRELIFLKYLPLIDVIPYSHKHSERTKLLIPMHKDPFLSVPHFNLHFQNEHNIHVIPTEYKSEFDDWLKIYRYAA